MTASACGCFRPGGFSAGAVAGYQGSRKDKDVGAPVGKVDSSIELGGYADYLVNDSLRVRGELVKGVTGHEGLVGQVGVDHFWRDGDKYAVTLGPRLLFSDAKYQRAYFGVSPAAAAATGLAAYRPGGGIHAVALASGVQTQFGPRWGLFGYARGERLIGDAAKSPLVRELWPSHPAVGGRGRQLRLHRPPQTLSEISRLRRVRARNIRRICRPCP